MSEPSVIARSAVDSPTQVHSSHEIKHFVKLSNAERRATHAMPNKTPMVALSLAKCLHCGIDALGVVSLMFVHVAPCMFGVAPNCTTVLTACTAKYANSY